MDFFHTINVYNGGKSLLISAEYMTFEFDSLYYYLKCLWMDFKFNTEQKQSHSIFAN